VPLGTLVVITTAVPGDLPVTESWPETGPVQVRLAVIVPTSEMAEAAQVSPVELASKPGMVKVLLSFPAAAQEHSARLNNSTSRLVFMCTPAFLKELAAPARA